MFLLEIRVHRRIRELTGKFRNRRAFLSLGLCVGLQSLAIFGILGGLSSCVPAIWWVAPWFSKAWKGPWA